MTTNSPQTKGRDRALLTLDTLIRVLDIAKNAAVIPPAQAAFGSASSLIAIIRDTMANKQDYVELGESCAHVCQALDRGLNGKQMGDLDPSVFGAIQQLTSMIAEIERKIVKRSQRNRISRAFHANEDKSAIIAWNRNLDRILQIFSAELSINNHTILLDIHRDVRATWESSDSRHQSGQTSTRLGESPPPPPRVCFGREELIEKVVDLTKNLAPVALVGPGGIGKTSIALTVLHDDRIKQRFGENRRFIRCDQFPPSLPNFLGRLSEVIGAGAKNPQDLTPLRSFLSSRKILIVLDNAESILDPERTSGREIYGVVEELSQFKDNISLIITSRITTTPPDCETIQVPTLTMDSARSTFRRIYNHDERPELVDKILRQLDFHALSVTLLATVARQNDWDNDRLWREWEKRQTGVLQTKHKSSLAATIELSLASPMFEALGPHAPELLGVIAFYPQGVDENNVNWLFPSIPDKETILDTFQILSLTYRNNGYVTMLAPLRDHLSPANPTSSPLLCATKELYFTRLLVEVDPIRPGFDDARWIVSEDVNVEHLLDVFTSADMRSVVTWEVCAAFMQHLHWHKLRQTVLSSKIEQLPDDHPFKPICLFELSRLFEKAGNFKEQKRLLTHTLKLDRSRGDDSQVAITLSMLSETNRLLNLFEEGIQQAREASEICKRLGSTVQQRACLIALASLLREDNQLDAAEEVVFRIIDLLPEKGEEFWVCRCHRLLGDIYCSRGERDKAIHQYHKALKITSPWPNQLFLIHYTLSQLYRDQNEFDNARAHIEQAKPHAVNNAYHLGRAMEMDARIWYRQGRLGDAMSGVSAAVGLFEKVGASGALENGRAFLQDIQRVVNGEEPRYSW